jgi:hypothetical protein
MLHQGLGSANDLRPGEGIADKPANASEANLGTATRLDRAGGDRAHRACAPSGGPTRGPGRA